MRGDCDILLFINSFYFEMLSQDYFGFVGLQSKSSRSIYRKATQRTQLSQDKVNSREKAMKEEEQGIQKLKIKYDQIMKKNDKKKKHKKKLSRQVQQNYYHGARIKYFHYNDEGYYNENQKIKRRVESKALKAFQRIKTQESGQERSSKIHSRVNLTYHKQPENSENKITNKEDDWQLEGQSKLKRSCYSDSNLLKESSRNGRRLRRMKQQQKNQHQKSQLQQKSKEFYLHPGKQHSSYSKSQILLVNSIPRSQTSHFMPMVSKVGLQSKINEPIEIRKYPHSSHGNSINRNFVSTDLQAIRKMQAQGSVVKLLKDSKRNQSKALQPPLLKSSKRKLRSDRNEDSLSSLSNVIKESGRIFSDKKSGQFKYNRVNDEYHFTGTFGQSQFEKMMKSQERQSNSMRSYQENSKIPGTASKLQSNPDYDGTKKFQTHKIMIHPSEVKEIQSAESQQFIQSKISKDASMLMKLESKENLEKSNSFLIDTIKEWRDYEEKTLYSKLMWKNQEGVQFMELIQNLYKHLDIINQIIDFVEMSAQLYEYHQQSHWIELQSFLIFKKFYQERTRMLQSLKQAKTSCFKYEKAMINSYSLLKYRKHDLLKEIADCIENGNIILWKSLNSYYWHIRQFHANDPFLNLDSFKKKDLEEMVKRLNEEVQILIERIEDMDTSIEENNEKDREIIYERIFKIMELTFLVSCLEGRQVKKYDQEDHKLDYELYCKEYNGKFKETVLYFN